MRLWMKLLVLFLAILAIGIWVLARAPKAAPVKDGTSADFWCFACWVDLGSSHLEDFGGIYAPRDGWFIYYLQGFHGQFLFRVEESVAMADFPAVLTALEARPMDDPRRIIQQGFQRWKHARADENDARGLFDAIRTARLEKRQQEDPELYELLLQDERDFQERWGRAQRYWLTVLFEFVVVAGLVVFAALPWLYRARRLAWSIHLGLLPVLLFLPWYLGYVPLVFTSAYPSGGIIYPALVFRFRGLPWTALDAFLLERTPKILEPLWQPPGPMLSLTGYGGVGPVAAAGMGLVLAASVWIIPWVVRRIRSRWKSTST